MVLHGSMLGHCQVSAPVSNQTLSVSEWYSTIYIHICCDLCLGSICACQVPRPYQRGWRRPWRLERAAGGEELALNEMNIRHIGSYGVHWCALYRACRCWSLRWYEFLHFYFRVSEFATGWQLTDCISVWRSEKRSAAQDSYPSLRFQSKLGEFTFANVRFPFVA